MTLPLILASQSIYRKELLQRLQVPFECVSPDLDESPFKSANQHPQKISEALSLAKAEKVFSSHPNACVIGGDQVAHLKGRILNKPLNKDNALEQLTELCGKTHELFTSISVLSPQGRTTFTDVTQLTMRTLSTEALQRYIEKDQPLDCAGSYKIEKLGVSLFEKIETQDPTAIVGIPLMRLQQTLTEIGYIIP